MRYGAKVNPRGTRFRVHAPLADAVALCLFDGEEETRHPMQRDGGDWVCRIPGDLSGTHYGYRAEGRYDPPQGLWFDPAKLLVDPYAEALDRRFMQDPRLAEHGVVTSAIVPRAIVQSPLAEAPRIAPFFDRGGLIYELNVRGYTMLHPDVPQDLRGTVAALVHPAVIAHFKQLHISAIELMPIIAWIDERHLPPLGLVNAWGYNPVAPLALEPGLCPGGLAELRDTVNALHAEGIGVILDVVLNHTGESDMDGGTFCLRGLDPQCYAREPSGQLTNVTGTGNTMNFAYAPWRELALWSLRHFVRYCGIDGYRFDLAPVLGRSPGFDPDAPFFTDIAEDEWLRDRVMIAEPWDIGWGGYQLGNFPKSWLEWNDRYRDDVRRFWRGDAGVGVLATRIAGSSDLFGNEARGVSFLAAHDGFTLADTVTYENRHNLANGEENRDGHGENFSWNNGAEGPSGDPQINARRSADLRAMLGTLFASTGTIMLTAGDEFGRSQQGNNNAYCQDNATGWVDWEGRDRTLEAYSFAIARKRHDCLGHFATFPTDGTWLARDGEVMRPDKWENPATQGFTYAPPLDSEAPSIVVDRAARIAGLD